MCAATRGEKEIICVYIMGQREKVLIVSTLLKCKGAEGIAWKVIPAKIYIEENSKVYKKIKPLQ